jgi:hypothetical protein
MSARRDELARHSRGPDYGGLFFLALLLLLLGGAVLYVAALLWSV